MAEVITRRTRDRSISTTNRYGARSTPSKLDDAMAHGSLLSPHEAEDGSTEEPKQTLRPLGGPRVRFSSLVEQVGVQRGALPPGPGRVCQISSYVAEKDLLLEDWRWPWAVVEAANWPPGAQGRKMPADLGLGLDYIS